MRIVLIILLTVLSLAMSSCKVKYSFSGGSFGALETVSVAYFQSRAALAPPTLSQYFTEEFKDLCERQTNMNLVSGTGDAHFEGEIMAFSIRPMAISPACGSIIIFVTIRASGPFSLHSIILLPRLLS